MHLVLKYVVNASQVKGNSPLNGVAISTRVALFVILLHFFPFMSFYCTLISAQVVILTLTMLSDVSQTFPKLHIRISPRLPSVKTYEKLGLEEFFLFFIVINPNTSMVFGGNNKVKIHTLIYNNITNLSIENK